MTVWIRRTLLAVGVVVVVALALAFWLISRFDSAQTKGLAIDWVKTHRDRTLAIDGPLELSVFPRLAVKLSRVSLSEVGRADEFAAIDEADLALELLPLLRGQLAVDRVHASGVRVALVRDAKGHRNFDDLAQAGPAEPSRASSAPIALDVRSIRLTDVRARIKDDVAAIDGELLVKELRTGRIASGAAAKIDLVVQFGLKNPALQGELRGACTITPEFAAGSFHLTDMDLSYKGDAPSASSIDASVRGELAYDGTKGAIDAKALGLRVSANTGAIKLADSSLEVGRFMHDPASKRVSLQQLKLRLAGTQGGKPLELRLDWPDLAVSGESIKGSPLTGRFMLGGELPIDAGLRSGAPAGTFDSIRVPSLQADLASNSKTHKIGGTARADVVLEPEKRAVALDALALDLMLELAGRKELALKLQGQINATAQMARWNLAGRLNADGFTTDGTANLAHTTPSIKANVRFDALDLNAVLPAAAPSAGGEPSSGADAAIDLSALRSANGSLALRAGSVALRQYRVADAVLDAAVEGGVLRVSTLQGRVWGGALDATAIADARASRVAVKATARGVDVGALLKDVAAKDLLDGKGRVDVDLDTAGRSVSEMKSRLKGSAALHVRDGAVRGFNLAKGLRQAKAALAAGKDAAQRASRTEQTDFSELSASFRIAEGVARGHDLEMKSPFLRLGGEGSIDIGQSRLDYTARATVTDTSKGQGGADLAALRGLTIPVQLSGPLEAIDWKVQWSAVVAGAVQQQVENKLRERLGVPDRSASSPGPAERLEDKVQDKVRDKLKDLFK
jgi:AsmA protein